MIRCGKVDFGCEHIYVSICTYLSISADNSGVLDIRNAPYLFTLGAVLLGAVRNTVA